MSLKFSDADILHSHRIVTTGHLINKQTREKITEGTSALFLLTSDAVKDKVVDALKGIECEILASNLTKEQEEELQAAFGQE